MKSDRNYDERQLIERGKIYRQSFILLVVLLLINIFVFGMHEIVWADEPFGSIIIILIAISYGTIRMIWKDAYNDIGCSKMNPEIIVLGIAGLLGICFAILQMNRKHIGFVSQGKLSSYGTGILIAANMLLICTVHLIKVCKDKGADTTEDE